MYLLKHKVDLSRRSIHQKQPAHAFVKNPTDCLIGHLLSQCLSTINNNKRINDMSHRPLFFLGFRCAGSQNRQQLPRAMRARAYTRTSRSRRRHWPQEEAGVTAVSIRHAKQRLEDHKRST